MTKVLSKHSKGHLYYLDVDDVITDKENFNVGSTHIRRGFLEFGTCWYKQREAIDPHTHTHTQVFEFGFMYSEPHPLFVVILSCNGRLFGDEHT